MFTSAQFPEFRFKNALLDVSLTNKSQMSVRVLYVAAGKNVSFLSKISSRLNDAVKADKNWNKAI